MKFTVGELIQYLEEKSGGDMSLPIYLEDRNRKERKIVEVYKLPNLNGLLVSIERE